MKYLRISILSIMVMMLFNSCNQKKEQAVQQVATTPVVSIASAQTEEVENTETYTSNIESNATNNIVSQSSGRIKKIFAEVGQRVSRGQLLAEMDGANLTKTHLQMVNDSIEFGRINELYKVGGVSQANYDLARLTLQISKETYHNLLENTELRSPISGIVSARNYDRGDMYSMGQPIFVVEQITPVKMLVNISENLFTRVKVGMEADIEVDALPGETFKGKVSLIHPTIDASTHTFAAEVTVANNDQKLRPGMFARVTMKYGTSSQIVVPDVAVVKQVGSGEHFIYTVNGDSVIYQNVELGPRIENRYVILSGINEGDKVVTEGQIKLKNGIKVTVK